MEEFCTPQFFANADEVFVSAASGIVPVGSIDGNQIGNGVGQVFAQLNAEYQKLIDSN